MMMIDDKFDDDETVLYPWVCLAKAVGRKCTLSVIKN